jgi:methionyl-tRNA formyltransferase
VSLAPRILPADRVLDLARDAAAVVAQVRSLAPRPAAHVTLRGRRINVLRASVVAPDGGDAPPGTVVALDEAGPVIACAGGAVRLDRVVPEGRSVMSGADLVRGQRIAVGDTLDVDGARAVDPRAQAGGAASPDD